MLVKPAAVVTNYTQKMVDQGFLEFNWVPDWYELTPPEGQGFEDEQSPSPPLKVEKPRPKPVKVLDPKKAGKSGGEDVEMAEVEEARLKRTIKRTEKARSSSKMRMRTTTMRSLRPSLRVLRRGALQHGLWVAGGRACPRGRC